MADKFTRILSAKEDIDQDKEKLENILNKNRVSVGDMVLVSLDNEYSMCCGHYIGLTETILSNGSSNPETRSGVDIILSHYYLQAYEALSRENTKRLSAIKSKQKLLGKTAEEIIVNSFNKYRQLCEEYDKIYSERSDFEKLIPVSSVRDILRLSVSAEKSN